MQIGVFASSARSPRARSISGQLTADPSNRPNRPIVRCAHVLRSVHRVEELVQVAPNWAFVRTRSNGRVTVKAIKQQVRDANHELFIFEKGDDEAWKIARYSFATTIPLQR